MTTFNIYFDGGTIGINTTIGKGCSGNGYGSWEVEWNGFKKSASRVPFLGHQFGMNITNNTAEYLSLLGALKFLKSVQNKREYTVKIHGDSQLVLFTLSGRYKTKKPHLKTFRDRCRKLLEGFSDFEVEWQGRINNVRRFGH